MHIFGSPPVFVDAVLVILIVLLSLITNRNFRRALFMTEFPQAFNGIHRHCLAFCFFIHMRY